VWREQGRELTLEKRGRMCTGGGKRQGREGIPKVAKREVGKNYTTLHLTFCNQKSTKRWEPTKIKWEVV